MAAIMRGAGACLGALHSASSSSSTFINFNSSSRSVFTTTRILHSPLRASVVLYQKGAAAKKPGGGGGGPATPAVEEKYDLKKQIPVNLLKEGPEPEYKADTEYPPWVFKLVEEKPLMEDLMMKGLENVSQKDLKSVGRRINKERIKDKNMASSLA